MEVPKKFVNKLVQPSLSSLDNNYISSAPSAAECIVFFGTTKMKIITTFININDGKSHDTDGSQIKSVKYVIHTIAGITQYILI